jgi:hypothetical protein
MMAQRLVIPSTAFSVAKTSQRRPRVEDKQHLAFIRTLRCCICGAHNPDPAHIRAAAIIYGKRETGMQEKAADKWVTPLCRTHHDEQHSQDELRWWASKSIDPFGLALALYQASGDDEIADGILKAHLSKETT